MKAAVLDRLGAVPRWTEFDEPKIGPGELRIEMIAAAVKPLERSLATPGHYASHRTFPVVVGTDGIGRGPDGRVVYISRPRSPFGTLAEATVADSARAVPVPSGVDPAEAAALVNPGLSSWLSLSERARLTPGESVLVLGATGTAGGLAGPIAKILGAGPVLGAARRPEAIDPGGFDRAFPIAGEAALSVEGWADLLREYGVTIILDYLGGEAAGAVLEAIGRTDRWPPGPARVRYVQIGQSGGATARLPLGMLRSRWIDLLGFGLGTLPDARTIQTAVTRLLEQRRDGRLHRPVRRFAPEEIEAAWAAPGFPRPVVVF